MITKKKHWGNGWPRKRRLRFFMKYGPNCVYCGNVVSFEDFHLDHFIPHRICQHYRQRNFVVSCSDCNSIKSGKYFESIYDAIEYIKNERKQRGIGDLSCLSEYLPPETSVAEVLPAQLSNDSVVDRASEAKALLDRVFGSVVK